MSACRVVPAHAIFMLVALDLACLSDDCDRTFSFRLCILRRDHRSDFRNNLPASILAHAFSMGALTSSTTHLKDNKQAEN